MDMIENGATPKYVTKRGKILFVDESHYDDYSGASNSKVLVGNDRRFWGYSDDPNIKDFE